MTPEEIIKWIDTIYFKENNYYLSNTMPEEFAKQVAIKFGKLAFEAGRKQHWNTNDSQSRIWEDDRIPDYETFEDYLKELYGETSKKT